MLWEDTPFPLSTQFSSQCVLNGETLPELVNEIIHYAPHRTHCQRVYNLTLPTTSILNMPQKKTFILRLLKIINSRYRTRNHHDYSLTAPQRPLYKTSIIKMSEEMMFILSLLKHVDPQRVFNI